MEVIEDRINTLLHIHQHYLAERFAKEALDGLTPAERKRLRTKVVEAVVQKMADQLWQETYQAVWKQFAATELPGLFATAWESHKGMVAARLSVLIPAAVERILPSVIEQQVPDALRRAVRDMVRALTQGR